jgi:hypothetical protein
MGVEEEEETQTKGTDKLFNRIIADNFLNLEKDRITRVKEAYRILKRTKKQTSSDTS